MECLGLVVFWGAADGPFWILPVQAHPGLLGVLGDQTQRRGCIASRRKRQDTAWGFRAWGFRVWGPAARGPHG